MEKKMTSLPINSKRLDWQGRMGQEKKKGQQQDVLGPSSHFAPVTTRSLLNDSPRLLFFKEYKQILKQSNQHEGQINRIFSSVAFSKKTFSMNNASS